MMELNLVDSSLKLVSNDALIRIYKKEENSDIITTEFDEWYEEHLLCHTFIIEITHPYLYSVPFPVKPIIFKTCLQSNMNSNFLVKYNSPDIIC